MWTILLCIIVFINNTYGESRYFVDDDTDLSGVGVYSQLAFPVDLCFQSHGISPLDPDRWVKYKCVDNSGSWEVTKETYLTSGDCGIGAIPQTSTQYTDPNGQDADGCGLYKYNCVGNDNYVTVGAYLVIQPSGKNTCSGTPVNIPVVTRTCFCRTDDTSYMAMCDDSSGLNGTFQSFSDLTCQTPTGNDTKSFDNCYYESEPDDQGADSKIQSCTEVTTPSPTVFGQTPSPTDATPGPTPITPSPTDVPSSATTGPTKGPTAPTFPPGTTFISNFVIDNDWILDIDYPWPIGKCLQTSPQLGFFGFYLNASFSYYECNSDGSQITKYKWDYDEIEKAGGVDNFDCPRATSEDYTTSQTWNSGYAPACEHHSFYCDGQDNYVTAHIEAALNDDWDCPEGSAGGLDLFTTSFVVQQCFCIDSVSSGMVTCDSTEAIAKNYTVAACSDDTKSIDTGLGEANKCSLFTTYSGLSIYGTMTECIVDGVNEITISPTDMPTKIPTETPTKVPTETPIQGETETPTKSPTDDKGTDNVNVLNTKSNIIIILLLIIYQAFA